MYWLSVSCKGGAKIAVEIRAERSSPRLSIRTAGCKLHILETMMCSRHSRNYSAPFGWTATFSWPLMSLRPAQDMSLGRWLLVSMFLKGKKSQRFGASSFSKFHHIHPKTLIEIAQVLSTNSGSFPSSLVLGTCNRLR